MFLKKFLSIIILVCISLVIIDTASFFSYLLVSFTFFFGGGDWSLKSRLHTCKADATLLEPRFQSILLWLFQMRTCELFAWAGLKP
jgi:hypothetical protein